MRSPERNQCSLPHLCVSCVFGSFCLCLRVYFNHEFILHVVRCSHSFAATAATDFFVSILFPSLSLLVELLGDPVISNVFQGSETQHENYDAEMPINK